VIAIQPNGQGNVLSPNNGGAGGVGGPSASPPGGTPKRQKGPAAQAAPNTFRARQSQGMARPTPQMAQQQAQAAQFAQAQAAQPAAPAAQPQPTPGANQAQVGAAPAGPSLDPLTQALNAQAQPAPTNVQERVAAQGVQSAGAPAPGAAPAAGGMAAPAPAAGGGGFQYNEAVNALGAPLMEQVMALLRDPTQGLNEAAQSNFDRQNRVLGREFTELREGLNENMAARGLDASTIAATGLGQLGARQADAQSDLAARVQEKLINDRATAMQAAIQSAMGLRGQEADLQKDEYVINENTGELEFRRGLDTSRLALDTELGRGNLQLGQDRLGLDRDRFGFDQFTDARDFDYRAGRDLVGDEQFDRRFDFDVNRDTRDFDYRVGRDAVGDERFERGFQRDADWRTEDNTYRDERDVKMDDRFERGFTRDADWRREDNEYRDGRDQKGDERWQDTFDQNQKNFDTGTIMDILRTMGITNIDPKMLDGLLGTLGVPQEQRPPVVTPTPPPSASDVARNPTAFQQWANSPEGREWQRRQGQGATP
jgi:hypothetical protein